MTEVIGTVFTKKGQVGDFDWHIKSGLYEDSLFIFNDDEKRRTWKKAGLGNAVIRQYNKYARAVPRSHGIVTGNDIGGYDHLSDHAKQMIDLCISEIKDIIQRHGYKKVYYSAKTQNGTLGTSIFHVGDDVLSYITQQIKQL